jgi:hypothetical protein
MIEEDQDKENKDEITSVPLVSLSDDLKEVILVFVIL